MLNFELEPVFKPVVQAISVILVCNNRTPQDSITGGSTGHELCLKEGRIKMSCLYWTL